MTHTTVHDADRGLANEAVDAASGRPISKPGTRAKVLVAIALALLALSLSLEERVTSWILGAPQATIADDRYLEEVRLKLRLVEARRNERSHQR